MQKVQVCMICGKYGPRGFLFNHEHQEIRNVSYEEAILTSAELNRTSKSQDIKTAIDVLEEIIEAHKKAGKTTTRLVIRKRKLKQQLV